MHVQETQQTSNVLFIVFILKYLMFSNFLFVIHICTEGSEFVLLAAQVQLLAVPQHKNETSVSRFKNGKLFFQIFQKLWYQVWVQFKQNFTKIRGSCFFIGHRQQFTLKAFSRSFVPGKLLLTKKILVYIVHFDAFTF